MNSITEILNKIKKNNFVVGIVGLGYVGLPLAVSFASKKVKTIGFESSRNGLLKNTYRLINISLINEMALLCGKMDIDKRSSVFHPLRTLWQTRYVLVPIHKSETRRSAYPGF